MTWGGSYEVNSSMRVKSASYIQFSVVYAKRFWRDEMIERASITRFAASAFLARPDRWYSRQLDLQEGAIV